MGVFYGIDGMSAKRKRRAAFYGLPFYAVRMRHLRQARSRGSDGEEPEASGHVPDALS
jgi:hypothetical protein